MRGSARLRLDLASWRRFSANTQKATKAAGFGAFGGARRPIKAEFVVFLLKIAASLAP